jgi:hypothetical protein
MIRLFKKFTVHQQSVDIMTNKNFSVTNPMVVERRDSTWQLPNPVIFQDS